MLGGRAKDYFLIVCFVLFILYSYLDVIKGFLQIAAPVALFMVFFAARMTNFFKGDEDEITSMEEDRDTVLNLDKSDKLKSNLVIIFLPLITLGISLFTEAGLSLSGIIQALVVFISVFFLQKSLINDNEGDITMELTSNNRLKSEFITSFTPIVILLIPAFINKGINTGNLIQALLFLVVVYFLQKNLFDK